MSGTDELAKLRRHMRIVVDLARLAGEAIPLGSFLDQACVQVARAIEIDHAKILRYRRPTADLLMEAGMGWKEGVVRSATFTTDLRSPPGRTYRTGEPTIIVDGATAEASGDFVFSDVLKEHSIVSLANVPILIDGAAWGVLEVDSQKERNFGDDTVEFMLAGAAIVGATIRRQIADGSEVEAATLARLQAREVLLREMEHRVRNNFQLVLASVALQKRRFQADEVHRALDHVANRINAISLAHDQLSTAQNLRTVDLARYLRALCTFLEEEVDNIAFEFEADEIDLAFDRAVPLGLILNEAATNAVKHAFGSAGGRIRVKLSSGVGYGEARLIVADNGRGMQQSNSAGSGQGLIRALARQIGGRIQQASSPAGTTIEVVFPVIS